MNFVLKIVYSQQRFLDSAKYKNSAGYALSMFNQNLVNATTHMCGSFINAQRNYRVIPATQKFTGFSQPSMMIL